MPKRIKLFSHSLQRELEDQVNAFIAELEAAGGQLIDAHFAAPRLEAGPNHMAVMVIYEPAPADASMAAVAAAVASGTTTVVINGPERPGEG
jgi:hypothetical protein